MNRKLLQGVLAAASMQDRLSHGTQTSVWGINNCGQ
jgi:hypothetical protein